MAVRARVGLPVAAVAVVAAGALGAVWAPAATAVPVDPAAAAQASAPPCVPIGGQPGPARVVTRDDRPGHAEPQIAVDPGNPERVLGAAEYVTSTGTLVLGAFDSADGGRTWHDFRPLPLPAGYGHGDDVSVGFAGAVGLVAAEAYPQDGGGSVLVWRTRDGGRHFSAPEVVFTAPASGRNIDHPWLAVTTKQTVVLAWNLHDTLLAARSVDRGATFGPPQVISAAQDVQPNLAVVSAGPAGMVAVMYQAAAGKQTVTKVVTSLDDGRTFDTPRTLPVPPGYALDSAPFASSLPAFAADPRTGTLYVALAQPPADGASRDIAVYRSGDLGRTWSAPNTVGGVAGDRFQPALAVAGNGTVYLAYYEYASGRVTRRLAASPDRGVHFPLRLPVSRPFDPNCGLVGVWKVSPWIGDYQGLTAGGGRVYAAWTDTSTHHPEIAVADVHHMN